ncbi:MAG: DUF420 domain-containing protein [Acidobacteria bacterium]|nr:MAG: DUF420 domain-containing protein [Acidobacteriota bacterium]
MSEHAFRERDPLPWALVLSAAVTAFLIWLIYFKSPAVEGGAWTSVLPAVNATLNSLCAVCLVAGYVSIRRGRRRVHKRFMLSALGFSALFLAGYVTYHHVHGDTPFTGRGVVRPIYFAVLISHVVLSVVMLPLILSTVALALGERFPRHKKLARFTLPIWLYVSLTGVVIFFFLAAYN